jgi:hypothetical protein
MILVPAIMTLLGRDAWWMPRWMEPIVPHLQLEGSAAAAAGEARSRQPAAATRPGGGGDTGEPAPRTYSAVSGARTRPGRPGNRDGGTGGTGEAGRRDDGVHGGGSRDSGS